MIDKSWLSSAESRCKSGEAVDVGNDANVAKALAAAAFDAVIDHVSEFVPDQIPVFAGDTAQYHREFFCYIHEGSRNWMLFF